MSKKIRRVFLVFFGITAIFTLVFLHHSQKKKEAGKATVTIRNAVVYAEVADTESLREKGLSGRTSLPDGTGMWFAYGEDGIYSFWMPDMHFPIDIMWFDKNFRAVYFKENATPESYPHVFTPDVSARYVLEAPAGFVKKNGIILGDTATVQKPY